MDSMIFNNDGYVLANQLSLRNYGKRWTNEEVTSLAGHLLAGKKMSTICAIMQRPSDGVQAKALQHRLIIEHGLEYLVDSDACSRCCDVAKRLELCAPAPSAATLLSSTKQGIPMAIETVVFIDGTKASTLSDAQIFTKIADLETEYAKLDRIQHKPEKLRKVMTKISADVAELVAYVDSRP
jgi:hypothetical protein